MKALIMFCCFVYGIGGIGCGVFSDPIQGEWVGARGERIWFQENKQFTWHPPNGKKITGSYSVEHKPPNHLDLFWERRHYKCKISLLNSYSERKILICFGKNKYPLMLDREKGEIFTFVHK
jgi:hypothetical protein